MTPFIKNSLRLEVIVLNFIPTIENVFVQVAAKDGDFWTTTLVVTIPTALTSA